jgi:hypothetical protein
MTTQVEDGKHHNQARIRSEEHPVRKITNQGAPNVSSMTRSRDVEAPVAP